MREGEREGGRGEGEREREREKVKESNCRVLPGHDTLVVALGIHQWLT